MNPELQNTIIQAASEIASRFNVPMPRIVFGNFTTAEYRDGTILIPDSITSREEAIRFIAHEMAHHIHVHYGIPVSREQAETFASTFEEAWIRKGYHYPFAILRCQVCGSRFIAYGYRATCPTCGSKYVYKHPSPSPSLGKAIGVAVLTGLGTYVLTTFALGRPEIKGKYKTEVVASASAGLIGFFAGLIL